MLVNDDQRLTIVQSILLAAAELDREQGKFSAEDLVVRAWKLFPDKFGLQGYAAKYPDSNRVLTKIMGATSALKTKGWIERVGTKRYRLSEVGRVAARDLSSGDDPTFRLAGLPRTLVSTLRRMLASSAVQKFRNREPLTFSDATSFWNISARSTANQLNLRLNEANTAVALAENAMSTESGTLPGLSQNITRGDLGLLHALGQELEKQFARELTVIRSRIDERYA